MKVKSLRDLDALVAEKVLGCNTLIGKGQYATCHCGGGHIHGDIEDVCHVKHYSTDIAAAWEVVEHVSGGDETDEDPVTLMRGNRIRRLYSSADWHGGRDSGWEVCFVTDSTPGYVVIAVTASLAICLAALKSVGVEVELKLL